MCYLSLNALYSINFVIFRICRQPQNKGIRSEGDKCFPLTALRSAEASFITFTQQRPLRTIRSCLAPLRWASRAACSVTSISQTLQPSGVDGCGQFHTVNGWGDSCTAQNSTTHTVSNTCAWCPVPSMAIYTKMTPATLPYPIISPISGLTCLQLIKRS